MRLSTFGMIQLEQVRTVLVHDNCADGTASAILLRDAFYGRPVNIRFLRYGTPAYEELVAEPGMLFCDMSPPAARAKEFLDVGAMILDHHRTAKALVESFGENGIFGDEIEEPGVCGAVLAYRHVWLPLRGDLSLQQVFAKQFAQLAGIHDTWQRHDPLWEEAFVQSDVLSFIPNERWMSKTLAEIAASWTREYRPIGEILRSRNARGVARALGGAYRFTSQKGTRVVLFQGLHQSSEAAEVLGEEADLVVGFGVTNEDGAPRYIFSTRSHTTFDCSTFCRQHGGGGHTKAAGCSVTIDPKTALSPYAVFGDLLDKYEASR